MTLSISFEVFPPKSADALEGLRSTVARLGEVAPSFVSVTYGAGGSDRERSFAAIDAVRSAGFDVAGHLTCVGQTRSDVDVVIDRYAALGVSQIVALRGDPPGGSVDRLGWYEGQWFRLGGGGQTRRSLDRARRLHSWCRTASRSRRSRPH